MNTGCCTGSWESQSARAPLLATRRPGAVTEPVAFAQLCVASLVYSLCRHARTRWQPTARIPAPAAHGRVLPMQTAPPCRITSARLAHSPSTRKGLPPGQGYGKGDAHPARSCAAGPPGRRGARPRRRARPRLRRKRPQPRSPPAAAPRPGPAPPPPRARPPPAPPHRRMRQRPLGQEHERHLAQARQRTVSPAFAASGRSGGEGVCPVLG